MADITPDVKIVTDSRGKKVVLINDLLFKSRNKIDWNLVEVKLKEYIGKCFEIIETSEKVFIGSDFPDEFAHSNDKIKLKGANEKAKANIVPAVRQLIEIATNKRERPDYGNKHGNSAKYGWYRYSTYLGIPVYSENAALERYNVFSVQMLVRRDMDGKLYLYDFISIKKEGVQPA